MKVYIKRCPRASVAPNLTQRLTLASSPLNRFSGPCFTLASMIFSLRHLQIIVVAFTSSFKGSQRCSGMWRNNRQSKETSFIVSTRSEYRLVTKLINFQAPSLTSDSLTDYYPSGAMSFWPSSRALLITHQAT